MDLLIQRGCLMDGAGNPWIRADVRIKNEKIVQIGKSLENDAEMIINAENLIVCPGFIDIHDHSDVFFFKDPQLPNKLMQGVTTNVVGLCGFSAAPVVEEYRSLLEDSLARVLGAAEVTFEWSTMKEYLDALAELPLGVNVASFVGHGTVRTAVLGMEDRAPTTDELEEMKALVDQAMQDGAYGLTSGLIYPPGVFVRGIDELVALLEVVHKFGEAYYVHPRNMAYLYVEAVQEAIDTAARAQVPLHISHIQAHGIENWDKVHRILQIMEDARTRGMDITGDAHPYLAASTFLKVLLPPWTHVGGSEQLIERLKNSELRDRIKLEMKTRMDYENLAKAVSWTAIVIATFPAHPEYQGKTLDDLAQLRNQDPYEALFDMLIDGGTEATMVIHALNFEQKATILAHPLVMVISDALGVSYGEGKPHPRCYGTFPRVLAEYVREKQILRLEEAIRKMTGFPAHRLGLRSRGLLKEGMAADLVIFDPKKISDQATFENPHQYPTGVEYVMVNGALAVVEGQLTGNSGGKVLRRGID